MTNASCFFKAFVKGFSLLKRNDPLILASATAFFTTFSISPIIVILVSVLSLYFQNDKITNDLFTKISATFGAETTEQIQNIVSNFRSFNQQGWLTIAGFIFLMFVATTLLKIVKQAIHQIWHIKRRRVSRLKYTFTERLIGLAIILLMGLLLVISLLLDTSVSLLHNQLQHFIPSMDVMIVRVINIGFSICVVTAWFTIVYKILPDARMSWNVALWGGLLTGTLFNIGKWLLGKMLSYNNVVTIFEASAALALLLLFIFYSALILYYGAAFTYSFAELTKQPIRPGKFSDRYEVRVVEDSDSN